MSKLFKVKIVSYRLPSGSYRTDDGQRVTSKTPGAVREVSKSSRWYGWVQGRRVPLSESKDTALRMLRIKLGDGEIASVLPARMKAEQKMQTHLGRTLIDHLDDFRTHLEGKEDSGNHVARTLDQIRAIMNACGFELWQDIDPDAILAWLAQRRKTSRRFGVSTSNHYLTAIKIFTRWLATTTPPRAPGDPLMGTKKLNAEVDVRKARRILGPDEFNAFMASTASSGKIRWGLTGRDRWVLYSVATYTGLRASELASLTPAAFDLDADQPTVTVLASYSKHRREDVLPLRRDLAGVLRTYLEGCESDKRIWPGNWFARGAVIVRFDLAAARAKWIAEAEDEEDKKRRQRSRFLAYKNQADEDFDFHAIRHSFIDNVTTHEPSVAVAMQLARHSDPKLTMKRYSHAKLKTQAATMERLTMAAPLSLPCRSPGNPESLPVPLSNGSNGTHSIAKSLEVEPVGT